MYEWLIGLGLMFGFGLTLSYLTDELDKTFFGYMTMMNAFVVWMELLPLWTLVISLLILLMIVILNLRGNI